MRAINPRRIQKKRKEHKKEIDRHVSEGRNRVLLPIAHRAPRSNRQKKKKKEKKLREKKAFLIEEFKNPRWFLGFLRGICAGKWKGLSL